MYPFHSRQSPDLAAFFACLSLRKLDMFLNRRSSALFQKNSTTFKFEKGLFRWCGLGVTENVDMFEKINLLRYLQFFKK